MSVRYVVDRAANVVPSQAVDVDVMSGRKRLGSGRFISDLNTQASCDGGAIGPRQLQMNPLANETFLEERDRLFGKVNPLRDGGHGVRLICVCNNDRDITR